ncbi:uncharacterized protein CIMG_12952 [Coccidioides immitis RS]|uniref:Uncharacterized protein n=1 Tax=Coccidioides immitis (strain RS) TaxID=246410 RepID=A0A0D8JSU5_COCIM|nr:uncharacterized protein CIMG_12952 [Coccidioides immitis RS]KJF60420.1 hypothetical protein CIMG_12952 [Coccidioides immitis RS]
MGWDAQKQREPAATNIINKYENDLNDLVELGFMEDTSNGNKCTLQYSDIGTLNDSILRLVDIKNINLKHIYNLTNKISDVDRDNRDNRNNEANRDNKDNRDDEDNKDNGKEQFSCS